MLHALETGSSLSSALLGLWGVVHHGLGVTGIVTHGLERRSRRRNRQLGPRIRGRVGILGACSGNGTNF